jgi:hypothetical protein
MTPSFTAFAGELLLIKQAEADEPQMTMPQADATPVQDEEKPYKSELPVLARERLKSALRFGIGSGLGAGTGYLASEKLLPRILPKGIWSDTAKRNAGLAISGLSAVGSLALWDAMRQAAKVEEDALQRHRQRV